MTNLHTIDVVAERLHYDPETGIFTWKVKPSAKVKLGSVAGKVRADGYRMIRVDGNYFYAHRLAFCLMHGFYPEYIDHINGNRDDNRIANLRAATASQNTVNQKKRADNRSGFKGIHYRPKSRLWVARAKIDGRYRYIGFFKTLEDAKSAYASAMEKAHGPFARAE